MKKLIFGVIVTATLVAGLVFYQNNKKASSNSVNTNIIQNAISKSGTVMYTITPVTTQKSGNFITKTTPTPAKKSLTLNMTEISKHNKESDCWMLISGKVYDITSYFGSHPGGNGTMAATCGTNATDAYMTKDPYATSSGGYSAHSSRAKNLLQDFYLGDFGKTISAN